MPKKIIKPIQENKPQDTRLTKYQKIIKELSAGKDPKKGGRPLTVLSLETYSQIIISLEYGLTEEQMITTGIIKRGSYYAFKGKSATFLNEIERAKQATSVSAIMHIATKIHGKPERVAKVYDRTGKEILKTEPAVEPDTETAKWWLQRKNKDEFSLPTNKDGIAPQAPNLGAPKTEREKELQLGLLKMYHDYVKTNNSQQPEDPAE